MPKNAASFSAVSSEMLRSPLAKRVMTGCAMPAILATPNANRYNLHRAPVCGSCFRIRPCSSRQRLISRW